MFDFSFFVDVSFRIINLVVLIFLLRYLFKNYLLDGIKSRIEERRQFMRGLEEHLSAVEHQKTLLAALIDQESGQGLQVQKKITSWANAAADDLRKRRSEKDQIERVISAHTQLRKDALVQLQVQRHVVPHVLDEAFSQLSADFEDPKVAQLVLVRIMTALKVKQ